MQDQIPEKVKAERSEIIRSISDRNKEKYFASMLGKVQRVLVEKPDVNGYAKGYGEHYIPVIVPGLVAVQNQFINTRLSSISEDDPSEVIADAI